MQQLRSYQISDLEQVKTIFNLNVPQYFAAHEVAELEIYLQEYADSYFVIERDQQIIGAGGYHCPSTELGRLSWDFFHPEFQGQGLGKMLIQHCLDELKQNKSLKSIEVWTSQFAYQFYAKFGFQIEKIEKNYWEKGFDLYLMRMLNH